MNTTNNNFVRGYEIQYGSYPAPHRPTIWQSNYKTGAVLFTTNKPMYEENIICVWRIRAKQTPPYLIK